MDKFNTTLAEILEVDTIDNNQELESFECWDSLTILSIIAMASENYKITLSSNEIRSSNSVGGLKELIKSKMS